MDTMSHHLLVGFTYILLSIPHAPQRVLAQNPLLARRRRSQNSLWSLATLDPIHQRQQDVMVSVVLGRQGEVMADPERSWAERRATMIHAGDDEESIEMIHGSFAHGFQSKVVGTDSVPCRYELWREKRNDQ